MRRSWKSTELYLTLILGFALAYFGPNYLPIFDVVLYLNILNLSYILSRTLSKKNRGQFHPGLLTSEMYLLLGTHATNVWGLFNGVVPQWAIGFIIGNQALYNLSRGLTKSIGIKNHFVI